jgi:hypothetical protein
MTELKELSKKTQVLSYTAAAQRQLDFIGAEFATGGESHRSAQL